mgnify:CR=1 FL=1|tara:strand:- start:6894 stop:7664 length:771 start_codon:yes stop_codon:yes gene_type:complete
MIKFFRHIRKSLLMENKKSKPALPAGRYLKYAIGEIILVVIGILIALGINNWNEKRKDTSFELKMLKEIQINLKKDLRRDTLILEERIKVKKEAIINVLEIINSNKKVEDSIVKKEFYIAGIGIVFTYDDGAYQALKAIGLDKISNDFLRNKLVRFFDHNLPLAKTFIGYNENYNYQKSEELKGDIVNLKYVKGKNWYITREISLKTLKNNPNVIKLLDLESDIHWNYNLRMNDIIRSYKEIIESVTQEIKRLEND